MNSYMISLCKRGPAECIEQCILFSPEQGYTEALQIIETLHGNPVVISDIYLGRQTKDLLNRNKTNASYVPLLHTNSNKIGWKRDQLVNALRMKFKFNCFIYSGKSISCAQQQACRFWHSQLMCFIRLLSLLSSLLSTDHPRTAYPSKQKVNYSNAKKSKVNAASTKHSKSVFMAKFCDSTQIHESV